MRTWFGLSIVGRGWRWLRLQAWRWALRNLSPDRVIRGDRSTHEALIAECARLQTRPDAPTVWKGALGVPYQLERRLRDEAPP